MSEDKENAGASTPEEADPRESTEPKISRETADLSKKGTPRGPRDYVPQGFLGAVQNVPVEVRVQIGSVRMSIAEMLKLGRGSVISLDKRAGEPVDVYVNDNLVARGEVVLVDDHIGVTLIELLKTDRLD
jgi:flagellar motor switch protein FliN/FliY